MVGDTLRVSIKTICKVMTLSFVILLLNFLLAVDFNEANAMTTTESTLVALIEKYGEENVIVENGISISVGQEKTMVSEGAEQPLSAVSTNDEVVQVLKGNSLKGITEGTAFVVTEVNGKYHILEVYVHNQSLGSKSIKSLYKVDSTGGYKVFVDAGHGGRDPGAIGNGVREADINLKVALKVEQKLKARNINVMMSRSTNVFVELKDRARLANEYGAHVFVSIHHNATDSSSVAGIETYYHEDKPQHRAFAEKLQKELVAKTGARNRGALTQDFFVNRETQMTSALVEGGYLTNPTEASNLNTDSYQEKIANAIVDGVYAYLRESVTAYEWVWENNHWYYVNQLTGELKTGWAIDGGALYFLEQNGVMQTGWTYIGGKWYYFNESGAMETGWITVDGSRYHLSSDGTMETGWLYLEGQWYFLNNSGEMTKGWIYSSGCWYFLGEDGAMATGWVLDRGTWYYLKPTGEMETGWIYASSKWFYLDSSGAMETGWHTIEGFTYYFYQDGHMAANTVIDGKKIDSLGKVV